MCICGTDHETGMRTGPAAAPEENFGDCFEPSYNAMQCKYVKVSYVNCIFKKKCYVMVAPSNV